ncbi:MAG: hypothetical protein DBX91_03890 [Subdoligranulum variabile]|nr:MAG: hypothetical protein DBX91_03890 [Subdoligranulum variabile]
MAYDGSITFETAVDTSGFSDGTGDINRQFSAIRKGAEAAASGLEKVPAKLDQTVSSASRLSDIVKGGGVFKLVEKGVNAVTASLDSAISRYDTMNRFPMMMQQLGYGADEAEAAVQRLSGGIQGLPTTLDSVVSTAQRLTILTGNLDGAVDTTLALNNAFLASGSSSDGAARGLEQYVQALSRGKFEAEEWKTMQETMGLALTRVAESFGYAGESAQSDLYAALQSGEVTMSQFNNRLIQLNNGVGGFADLAQTSSVGVKTAWTNMGTAMVRGTTTMITALDKGLSETKFESIQNVIETTGEVIEDSMNLAAPAIELVASHADVLVVSLGALTVAYGANQAVKTFSAAQKTATAAIVAADAAGKVVTPTINAKAVAEARAAAVAKLGTAATEKQIVAEMAANGVITAKTFALGGMTTGMGLATVASGLLTAATTALSTAINVLLGPVGLVVLGIGAVAAGAVAVYNAVTKESEAFAEQSEVLDGLADQQESLASSEESNAKAAQDNLKSIRASADAAGELAKELGELDSVENKSASQKQRMGEMVDELNEKYADLCLTYDEEADQLSMNADQLQEYIEAQQTMEEVAARQERYNELLDEEATIRQNVAELESMQTEWAAQLDQKIISQGEYNELMEQSKETLAAYAEQEQALSEQRTALDEEMAAIDTTTAQTIIANAQAQQEATRAAAEAEEAEMERRKEALQSYTEAATNMYDRIETESELTVNDMIANLQANQEAVATWADNLQALAERGIDQGLLQELRDAGPESAATVAELCTATDAQLQQLSEVYRAGGQAAATALQTELGLPEVTNAASQMVTNMATGMMENTALVDATTQMMATVKETATTEATTGTQDIGAQIPKEVATGIASTKDASTASTQMINEAKSAAQTAAMTGTQEIGLQMDNGIIAGINAGKSGVVNAMVSAVQEAIAAAQAAAEIHSPSRIMRDLIGLNMMRGWALGLEDGTPLIEDKAAGAVQAMMRAVGNLDPAQFVATMRARVVANQSRLAVPIGVAASAHKTATPTSVTNHTQNIYFEQPMQAPDEIARELRIQQTYGLAGDR